MKNVIKYNLLIFLLLICANAYSQNFFTRGAQEGEIYISSDYLSVSNLNSLHGLFRSRDNGETLMLMYRNDPSIPDSMVTVKIFNGFCPGILYNFYHSSTKYLWISKNHGLSWDTIYNSNGIVSTYLGGNDSAVIYKRNNNNLSMSNNYGESFNTISDSSVNLMGVGNNAGELLSYVRVSSNEFDLYKMINNSGEFNLIGRIDTSITNGIHCRFSRGAVDEELYFVSIHKHGTQEYYKIYFSENYGETFQLRFTSEPFYYSSTDFAVSGGVTSGDFYVCITDIDYNIPAYVVTINYSSDTAKSFTSYYHILDETVTIEDNENILKPEKLEVFPNPTNSSFSISIPSCFKSSGIIEIYNLHGNVVFEELFNKSDENMILNTSGWINGAYVICISDNNGNTMKEKLLVLK